MENTQRVIPSLYFKGHFPLKSSISKITDRTRSFSSFRLLLKLNLKLRRILIEKRKETNGGSSLRSEEKQPGLGENVGRLPTGKSSISKQGAWTRRTRFYQSAGEDKPFTQKRKRNRNETKGFVLRSKIGEMRWHATEDQWEPLPISWKTSLTVFPREQNKTWGKVFDEKSLTPEDVRLS